MFDMTKCVRGNTLVLFEGGIVIYESSSVDQKEHKVLFKSGLAMWVDENGCAGLDKKPTHYDIVGFASENN